MPDNAANKQFVILLEGFNVLPGGHYLTVFGAIKQIAVDDPTVRRFDSREEAEQWVEGYNTRPFCAFSATVVEL